MMFKNRRKSKDIASSTTKVIIQDISKDLIPITGSNKLALLLHNLLTPDECSNLIKRAEEQGYDIALVAGPNGSQILRQDIRSCGRCIIDDEALADAIYDRILNAIKGHEELKQKILHAPWVTSLSNLNNINNKAQDRITAVGLNERMRFLKYNPGHFFAPHQDIQFVRGAEFGPEKQGETSYITVQLYLNDKFKGGTTRFLSCRNSRRHYDVKPKIGSALIFDHDILHQGSQVLTGTKYSVRTDIMFTPRKHHQQQQHRVQQQHNNNNVPPQQQKQQRHSLQHQESMSDADVTEKRDLDWMEFQDHLWERRNST